MKRLPPNAFIFIASLILGLSSSVRAAIVYSDDFSSGSPGSPVNLNGSAPDVGAATWISRTTSIAMTTNGSSANGINSSTSSLPLTVSAGNIYTLSATITYGSTSTSLSFFGGIGFFNSGVATATDTSYNNTGENTPWMFIRAGYSGSPGNDARTGDISTRPTGGTGIVNTDSNLTVTNPVKLTLILDTTGSLWTVRSFYEVGGVSTENDINGATAGTAFTYNSTQTAALASSIAYVGLSNAGSTATTVSWSNFQLDVVPEPSAAVLALGGLGLCFVRRRA